SRTDRVCRLEVFRLDEVRRARKLLVDQDAATTDDDHRYRLGTGLHAVNGGLAHLVHAVERGLDERLVEVSDLAAVANVGDTGGDRDIGRRQGVAAEDERLLREAVANGLRADL